MERIPILKMGPYLLVSIQVDMHDRLAMQLQDDLTDRIAATGARAVLIDISALDMVDSFMGRMLGNIAAMSRVLIEQLVNVHCSLRCSQIRWQLKPRIAAAQDCLHGVGAELLDQCAQFSEPLLLPA